MSLTPITSRRLRTCRPILKALDIEAMLASELQLRVGEDVEFQPLSERLKRIVQQKRAGTLAGLALLKELEELTKQTVALIQESQRPLVESIARAAQASAPSTLPSDEASALSAVLLRGPMTSCIPAGLSKSM